MAKAHLGLSDKKYLVKKNDIIACPVGNRSSAHQFINDSKSDLKYLVLGTKTDHDICEYPDSDKVLARSNKMENPYYGICLKRRILRIF